MLTETIVDEAFIKAMDVYREKPKGKGLIEACSQSVVLFAENMLGVKLRAWQIYVLMAKQRNLEGVTDYKEFGILTARQIGKSTMIAIWNLWLIVFNKCGKGLYKYTPVAVVSAADDQAKKLIKDILRFMRIGDKFMRDSYKDANGKPLFGKDFFSSLVDDKEANNSDTITFKAYNPDIHGDYLLKGSLAGSFIKSHPPTPIILGNTYADFNVDEAGKSEKITDEVFLDYIRPTTNEFKAPLTYTSTPWTQSGIFYETMDVMDERTNPRVFRAMFTIEAIKLEDPDRYNDTMKDIEQLNKSGKINEVQRAFYCRFVKGELNYFDGDNVRASFTNEYQQYRSFTGECDMGVDFGAQVVSRTVITISRLNEQGTIERLYHRRYEIGADLNLLDDIADLLKRFNVQRIIPDNCPAGSFMIKQMVEKGWNVQPVSGGTVPTYGMAFRTDKVKKYGAFRAMLNRGKIKSYIDSELQTEMLSMEQSETAKQSLIQHAPGYTDDLIDSFVMSTYFFIEEDDDVFKYHDVNDYEDDELGEDSYYEARF